MLWWICKGLPEQLLSSQENEDYIGKLDSKIVVTKTQDSNKDTETSTCSISIPDNIYLSETANLPEKLKLCVGARVKLTYNISVSNRLINGSIDTVRSKSLCSTIYVKFDDPKADKSLKQGFILYGELKECVSVTARTKRFPLKKGK